MCRAHEAAALVRRTADEECDNICRLSTFFLGRVLSDWQVAVMLARSHPHSAHIMVGAPPLFLSFFWVPSVFLSTKMNSFFLI